MLSKIVINKDSRNKFRMQVPFTIGDRRESIIGILATEAGTESGEGVVLAVDLNTLNHGLVSNDGAELGVLLALHAAQDLTFNKDSESLVQPSTRCKKLLALVRNKEPR